jgi:hypothetical protein
MQTAEIAIMASLTDQALLQPRKPWQNWRDEARYIYRDYRPTPAENEWSHTSILPVMPSRRAQGHLYLTGLYGKQPTCFQLDEPCFEVFGRTTLTSDRPVAYLHRTAHIQAGT